MVGTTPTLIRDVNAAELGRIRHNRRAQQPKTTVVAFCGRPFELTFPTQPEKGKVPSREIANMMREAAREMI